MIDSPYYAQINKLCTTRFLEEHVSQKSALIYIVLTITIQDRFNRTHRWHWHSFGIFQSIGTGYFIRKT